MSVEEYSNGHPQSNSWDAITAIVVSPDELGSLPPDALVVRLNGDTSHLPADLRGKVVYYESVEDHTIRPMTPEERQKVREYWQRLGRDEPPRPPE
jgi:hypothetical protein